LDRWLVLDDIIPFLPQIPSKDPAVIMGILGNYYYYYFVLLNNNLILAYLGVYRIILSHKKMYITKETMALSILPFLIPMCIENTLTLNQFNVLISIVKEMITSVETDHRAKLQQLNEQHRYIYKFKLYCFFFFNTYLYCVLSININNPLHFADQFQIV